MNKTYSMSIRVSEEELDKLNILIFLTRDSISANIT